MSAKWKRRLRAPLPRNEASGGCKQCGACCAFISIPPFKEHELDRLPADIRQVVEWYTQNDRVRPQSPTPCYFYDMTNRICLIHGHKPQACRDFEPGGPACQSQRSDLLGSLNHYYNATRQWAKCYTRVVSPGGRIQEIGEFRVDDQPSRNHSETIRANIRHRLAATARTESTRSRRQQRPCGS